MLPTISTATLKLDFIYVHTFSSFRLRIYKFEVHFLSSQVATVAFVSAPARGAGYALLAVASTSLQYDRHPYTT
jgi:hypothetical protein